MFGVIRVCVLCLGVWAGAVRCAEGWEVRPRAGAVRGRLAPSGDHYAFLGIPYGAPPTGEHRFKPPQPAAPWSGVLEANATRRCVQPRGDGGAEDCLLLSVFAQRGPRAAPRPVLVQIPGGGFLFDTRPLTPPDVAPILSHDIIVVAINYRVGALGFLCLGTEEAPGNAGLHDQLLALRWVQENIGAFGGDPGQVTVVGSSAGGSSIHLLAVSPAADGLFRRGICLDGTALADKTLKTYPITSARTFAKLLGFSSDNIEELTKFYKEVSPEKIVSQSMNFFSLDNGEQGFSPCVERPVPGVVPVVARPPATALQHNRRPMLYSYCDYEGSLRSSDLIKPGTTYNTDFPAYMPANLNFPSNRVKYIESNRTRSFYFGNRNISVDTVVEYSDFWGDRQIVYQTAFSVSEHVRLGGAAYLLEFAYVGGLSQPKEYPSAPGASHGDSFNYLFPERVVDDENDQRVVNTLTSIVAQFVKTGEAVAAAPWPTASPDIGRLRRLRVDNNTLEPRDKPLPAPLALWDRLYRRYRRTDYSRYEEDAQDNRIVAPEAKPYLVYCTRVINAPKLGNKVSTLETTP